MTKIIHHRPSLMPLLCSGLISTQLPAQQHLILPENHSRFLRQNSSNHSFAWSFSQCYHLGIANRQIMSKLMKSLVGCVVWPTRHLFTQPVGFDLKSNKKVPRLVPILKQKLLIQLVHPLSQIPCVIHLSE